MCPKGEEGKRKGRGGEERKEVINRSIFTFLTANLPLSLYSQEVPVACPRETGCPPSGIVKDRLCKPECPREDLGNSSLSQLVTGKGRRQGRSSRQGYGHSSVNLNGFFRNS